MSFTNHSQTSCKTPDVVPTWVSSFPLLYTTWTIAFGRLELLKELKRNPCDLPDFIEVPGVPELLEDKMEEVSGMPVSAGSCIFGLPRSTMVTHCFCDGALGGERTPIG